MRRQESRPPDSESSNARLRMAEYLLTFHNLNFKTRPDLCFVRGMRSIASKANKQTSDFYTSTLAPVEQQSKVRICIVDVVILTVLFLELAVLMRFLLAK